MANIVTFQKVASDIESQMNQLLYYVTSEKGKYYIKVLKQQIIPQIREIETRFNLQDFFHMLNAFAELLYIISHTDSLVYNDTTLPDEERDKIISDIILYTKTSITKYIAARLDNIWTSLRWCQKKHEHIT